MKTMMFMTVLLVMLQWTHAVETSCPANHKVDAAKECVACPPGKTNTKGDSLAGPETFCDFAEVERHCQLMSLVPVTKGLASNNSEKNDASNNPEKTETCDPLAAPAMYGGMGPQGPARCRFYGTVDGRIAGHDIPHNKGLMTGGACFAMCLAEPKCKSVDWIRGKDYATLKLGTCSMNDCRAGIDTAKALNEQPKGASPSASGTCRLTDTDKAPTGCDTSVAAKDATAKAAADKEAKAATNKADADKAVADAAAGDQVAKDKAAATAKAARDAFDAAASDAQTAKDAAAKAKASCGPDETHKYASCDPIWARDYNRVAAMTWGVSCGKMPLSDMCGDPRVRLACPATCGIPPGYGSKDGTVDADEMYAKLANAANQPHKTCAAGMDTARCLEPFNKLMCPVACAKSGLKWGPNWKKIAIACPVFSNWQTKIQQKQKISKPAKEHMPALCKEYLAKDKTCFNEVETQKQSDGWSFCCAANQKASGEWKVDKTQDKTDPKYGDWDTCDTCGKCVACPAGRFNAKGHNAGTPQNENTCVAMPCTAGTGSVDKIACDAAHGTPGGKTDTSCTCTCAEGYEGADCATVKSCEKGKTWSSKGTWPCAKCGCKKSGESVKAVCTLKTPTLCNALISAGALPMLSVAVQAATLLSATVLSLRN